MLEAFLNIQIEKSDAGVGEEPLQWAQASAEQEQVTTELSKTSQRTFTERKRGFLLQNSNQSGLTH